MKGNWGQRADRSTWPGIAAVRSIGGTSLLLDMPLSTFFIGYLCSLAATNGTQDEVRKKACETLDPQVFEVEWLWRYTPVPIRSLCFRSFALGVYITVLIGFPSFLFTWMCLGGGVMSGFTYTFIKGFWAMTVSGIVYSFVFPSAIDKRNFPELEFEDFASLNAQGEGEAPPMIGKPALI